MPNDLAARIADLRRLRDAASPLPWECDVGGGGMPDDVTDRWYAIGPTHDVGPTDSTTEAIRRAKADRDYMAAAANLAPTLADEWERVSTLYYALAAAVRGPMCTSADHPILVQMAAAARERQDDRDAAADECERLRGAYGELKRAVWGEDNQEDHALTVGMAKDQCQYFDHSEDHDKLRSECERLRQENENMRGELATWKPLTAKEAQAAYDAAKPVPLSEERIQEIVKYATGQEGTP